MNMPFSVTQLRIGLLAANFVCTGLVGYQTYAVVTTTPNFENEPPMPTISSRSAAVDTEDKNLVLRVKQLGRKFLPLSKPVVETPSVVAGPKDEPPPEIKGDDDLPPGVLDNSWKLTMTVITSDPADCFATLQKKDPSLSGPGAGSGAGAAKKPAMPRISTSKTVAARPKVAGKALPGAVPGAGDKKVVRPMDHWEDPDAGIDVWIVEVTQDRLIYEDVAQPNRRFALHRERPPYASRKQNRLTLEALAEEPDPNNPQPDKKLMIHFDPPDRRKAFEERNLGKTGAGSIKPMPSAPGAVPAAGTKTIGPAGAKGAKGAAPTTAEQLKQLRDLQKAVQGLEKNDKFQRDTTPEQRKELQEILGVRRGLKSNRDFSPEQRKELQELLGGAKK